MDLFPITLTNRDMNSFLLFLEGYSDELSPVPPGMKDGQGGDIDPLKSTVSQLSPREMYQFLSDWESGIVANLEGWRKEGVYSAPVYNEYAIEELGELRRALSFIQGLKKRIRRPRGQ